MSKRSVTGTTKLADVIVGVHNTREVHNLTAVLANLSDGTSVVKVVRPGKTRTAAVEVKGSNVSVKVADEVLGKDVRPNDLASFTVNGSTIVASIKDGYLRFAIPAAGTSTGPVVLDEDKFLDMFADEDSEGDFAADGSAVEDEDDDED